MTSPARPVQVGVSDAPLSQDPQTAGYRPRHDLTDRHWAKTCCVPSILDQPAMATTIVAVLDGYFHRIVDVVCDVKRGSASDRRSASASPASTNSVIRCSPSEISMTRLRSHRSTSAWRTVIRA